MWMALSGPPANVKGRILQGCLWPGRTGRAGTPNQSSLCAAFLYLAPNLAQSVAFWGNLVIIVSTRISVH